MMKVSELEGAELDAWVARAAGLTESQDSHGPILVGDDGFWIRPCGWMPSTDWAQGGPLVEREGISIVSSDTYRDKWRAGMVIWLPDHDDWHYGETALVAAMRCLVASKYGDTVPDA